MQKYLKIPHLSFAVVNFACPVLSLAVLLGIFAFSIEANAAAPTSGLVGYWNFDPVK